MTTPSISDLIAALEEHDGADLSALLAEAGEYAGAATPVRCEGPTARWCPRCGTCTCPEDGDLDSDSCPLHSSTSDHAEPDVGLDLVDSVLDTCDPAATCGIGNDEIAAVRLRFIKMQTLIGHLTGSPAIAWFGTHRGALAEALRTAARERDEARLEVADWRARRLHGQCLHNERQLNREAESLRALLDESARKFRSEMGWEDDDTTVDLLARIDLARGKDGAR